MSSNEKLYHETSTLVEIIDNEGCILCQSHHYQLYNKFPNCNHQFCPRCFKLLEETPNRPNKCPICNK